MIQLPSKIRRLLFWVALVFALDFVSKLLIVHWLPLGSRVPIIPNFFDLVHITNPGAAFGIFGNLPESIRFPFLAVVSLIAVGMIGFYYMRLPPDKIRVQIPLAAILGGAAGNLYDRFARGEVVDFLSVHWSNKWWEGKLWGFVWNFKLEWPAFNVADSAISISVVWLLYLMIREREVF